MYPSVRSDVSQTAIYYVTVWHQMQQSPTCW